MAEEIVMPRLSDSMEEGTILKWMKSVGDEVAVGDELVEIETDKANMVYESDAAGSLIEITAEEGATLPIGDVIARIGEGGEAPSSDGESKDDEAEQGEEESAGDAQESDSSDEAADASPTQPAPDEAAEVKGDGRVKASPLAKRMAKEKGVDLGGLQGSGPGGRIIKADV